ncbi:MAG: glycerophosphodiester phosphodiesterase [Clostridia bacterium]|nr:glycerophosphodiester phosphodiesterase [Clostridia bacterium]
MLPKILLISGLSVLGSAALLFCIYLLLIRTKKAHNKIAAYRGVNLAHRGLHGEGAAENSMTAFRRAKEAGFGVELDVRLSKDGELVVFHDDTLTRVAGVEGRVDELTLAELRECRLSGTDDTIPTLREVFDLIDGSIPILIEVKEKIGSSAVTRKLLAELKSYDGPYIVESFDPMAISAFRKGRREVPLGILSRRFCDMKEHKGSPLYFALQNMLFNFLSVPDFVAYRHSDANTLSLKLARSLFGTVTVAWTTRSAEEGEAAKKNGFDCIIFENYLPEDGRADVSKLPKFVN